MAKVRQPVAQADAEYRAANRAVAFDVVADETALECMRMRNFATATTEGSELEVGYHEITAQLTTGESISQAL